MGFRSTFTTQDYDITWPLWFYEKYERSIYFRDDHRGALHSKREAKTYDTWDKLEINIQAAIDWSKFKNKFVLVWLHECGGITRCQIERDSITWSEPIDWEITEGVVHDYCYGCSDVQSIKEKQC